MNNIKPMLAQAIRFGIATAAGTRSLNGRSFLRALEERYDFVEVPRTAEDFVFEKGVVFRHGFSTTGTVIDNLKVYNNGLVVETKSTTDDCDAIIDDLINSARNVLGFEFVEDQNLPRMYLSHFELELGIHLEKHISALEKVCSMMTEYMRTYRDRRSQFNISGFEIKVDPTIGGPTSFKLERRANVPYITNMYYSSAPLRTEDHINLLEKIESLFPKHA